jgi:hypothetical protein
MSPNSCLGPDTKVDKQVTIVPVWPVAGSQKPSEKVVQFKFGAATHFWS